MDFAEWLLKEEQLLAEGKLQRIAQWLNNKGLPVYWTLGIAASLFMQGVGGFNNQAMASQLGGDPVAITAKQDYMPPKHLLGGILKAFGGSPSPIEDLGDPDQQTNIWTTAGGDVLSRSKQASLKAAAATRPQAHPTSVEEPTSAYPGQFNHRGVTG